MTACGLSPEFSTYDRHVYERFSVLLMLRFYFPDLGFGKSCLNPAKSVMHVNILCFNPTRF